MRDFLMSTDEFEDYVLSFYNRTTGLYPFNCSDATIRAAIYCVVEARMNSDTFAADSTDREAVRRVLETLGYRERDND
jgi:hypothetical protein